MNKQNKLRSGIFALAMVLLCNPLAFAQSGKTSATGSATATTKSQDKHPAATELKNFETDASNPEWSDAQLRLLKAKAELEARQGNNTLSKEEIAGLEMRIGTLDAKVKALQARDPRTQELNQREQAKKDYARQQVQSAEREQTIKERETAMEEKKVLRAMVEDKQCTRAQFLSLTQAQQREMLVNVKGLTITDLVNATPEAINQRTANTYIITEDNFRNTDVKKQIYVLNNPATYLIVKDGTVLPKPRISKAELESYPAERQKMILESNQYEITN